MQKMKGPVGSFARWQTVQIAQLTHASNLVLGLAVGALGFQVTIVLADKLKPHSWQQYANWLSLFSLTLSVAFGILLVINRVRDFRETTIAARKREEGKSDDQIEPHRVLYRKLGKRTWWMFWWQTRTLAVGALLTVLGVAASVFAM